MLLGLNVLICLQQVLAELCRLKHISWKHFWFSHPQFLFYTCFDIGENVSALGAETEPIPL